MRDCPTCGGGPGNSYGCACPPCSRCGDRSILCTRRDCPRGDGAAASPADDLGAFLAALRTAADYLTKWNTPPVREWFPSGTSKPTMARTEAAPDERQINRVADALKFDCMVVFGSRWSDDIARRFALVAIKAMGE